MALIDIVNSKLKAIADYPDAHLGLGKGPRCDTVFGPCACGSTHE